MRASRPEFEPDLLSAIPSPSTRLWVGLGVVLSIFVVFAFYAIHKVRWLEDFQVNVVQRNRKASLQLLRLQNDAYLVATSLRGTTEIPARYRIADWRTEFARLRNDMDDAMKLEGLYTVRSSEAGDQSAHLQRALQDFWDAMDRAFAVASRGQEAAARRLLNSEGETKRAVLSEIVARLLVSNDQAQAEATERINAVYGSAKTEILMVIGVLFLLALGTGLYTLQANRKTFERLRHLAEKLQVQSEQLRQLSWKVIQIQEETLRQVARDLHDEFGQILTAIGVMLGRHRKTLDGDSALLGELGEVKSIVEDTLRNVRDRSQMFRPAILDDFGLEQTLQWFAGQFSRQAGIKVHLEGKVEDDFFPSQEAIHLYRIVQEALNNVARHAKAQEAWVTLSERDGWLNLEIRDAGAGFKAGTEMGRPAGVGLMGMRERAEHLGGSMQIESSPGQGTVVRVSVPLKRSALPRARVGS